MMQNYVELKAIAQIALQKHLVNFVFIVTGYCCISVYMKLQQTSISYFLKINIENWTPRQRFLGTINIHSSVWTSWMMKLNWSFSWEMHKSIRSIQLRISSRINKFLESMEIDTSRESFGKICLLIWIYFIVVHIILFWHFGVYTIINRTSVEIMYSSALLSNEKIESQHYNWK